MCFLFVQNKRQYFWALIDVIKFGKQNTQNLLLVGTQWILSKYFVDLVEFLIGMLFVSYLFENFKGFNQTQVVTVFYRLKHTLQRYWLYFLCWPTLCRKIVLFICKLTIHLIASFRLYLLLNLEQLSFIFILQPLLGK